jgi:hypothetical protein
MSCVTEFTAVVIRFFRLSKVVGIPVKEIAIPVKEFDDKIKAVMFMVVLFLCDFNFHFGSVFRIKNQVRDF